MGVREYLRDLLHGCARLLQHVGLVAGPVYKICEMVLQCFGVGRLVYIFQNFEDDTRIPIFI